MSSAYLKLVSKFFRRIMNIQMRQRKIQILLKIWASFCNLAQLFFLYTFLCLEMYAWRHMIPASSLQLQPFGACGGLTLYWSSCERHGAWSPLQGHCSRPVSGLTAGSCISAFCSRHAQPQAPGHKVIGEWDNSSYKKRLLHFKAFFKSFFFKLSLCSVIFCLRAQWLCRPQCRCPRAVSC